MAKDKTKSSTHTSSPLARMDASFKARGRVGFYGQCKLLETSFFTLVRIARAITSPTSAILANR